MNVEKFFRVVYEVFVKGSEVLMRPTEAFLFSPPRSSFVHLLYEGDALDVEVVKADARPLLQIFSEHGEWRIRAELSIADLLDHLWKHGRRNLRYLNPKHITSSSVGLWYCGSTLRCTADAGPISCDAIKIAVNEVLDDGAWMRVESYMWIGSIENGGEVPAGLVYGSDDEDSDAVRLATVINEQNGTPFGKPGYFGVDSIGACGGAGKVNVDALKYAVLSRFSSNQPWFLAAALVRQEHAFFIRQLRVDGGCEARVVPVTAGTSDKSKRAPYQDPCPSFFVQLEKSSVEDRASLQDYIARLVAQTISAAKDTNVDILPSSGSDVGRLLYEAADPKACMNDILRSMPDEVLAGLFEQSLTNAVADLINKDYEQFCILCVKNLLEQISNK